MSKLKPKFLREQIKEIRNHLNNLEYYLDYQVARHRKLDDGNGTYDPVQYPMFQIMLHSGIIRSRLNMSKTAEGADGKGKQFCELQDGSLMKCYR